MDTHLTEDDMVLHYYGEMARSQEAQAAAHLARCPDCHDAYRRLQRVLALVAEGVMAPDLPEHFERTVWARLEPALRPERGGWLSWFRLSRGRLAWVGAVAVLVVTAFMAGRSLPREDSAPTSVAAVPGDVRERILLVDLGDHLEQSQMMLVEIVSADDQRPLSMSEERARAGQLVMANRLYRQTAISTGDTAIVDLLDDLERVLVDVAASPENLSSQDLGELRRRIESRSLLFKVRVLSSDVRERQRSTNQERAGQRSSL